MLSKKNENRIWLAVLISLTVASFALYPAWMLAFKIMFKKDNLNFAECAVLPIAFYSVICRVIWDLVKRNEQFPLEGEMAQIYFRTSLQNRIGEFVEAIEQYKAASR